MEGDKEGTHDLKPRKKNEEEEQQEDETDSDDEFLVAAAAQWAEGQGGNEEKSDSKTPLSKAAVAIPKKEKCPTPDASEPTTPATWSLHVTQLSFEATDYDIRTAFVQRGCAVSSVRLVYDRDGAHRTFRGVAFVDVADEDSYKKGLELDRTVLQGRKINVRPTRSKIELANIVERTKQLVEKKITRQKDIDDAKRRDGAHEKDKKRTNGEHEPSNERNSKRQKDLDEKRPSSQKGTKEGGAKREKDKCEKSRPDKTKSCGDQSTRGVKAPKAKISKKHQVSKNPRQSHGDQKLKKKDQKITKKERNRRAAIIMAKKRGR
jgi:RNA recognition motif-containing protein